MTKKDYELIAQWLKDYSYTAEIRPEDGERYLTPQFYRGAIPALIQRLKKDNDKFNIVKFVKQSGHDTNVLGV